MSATLVITLRRWGPQHVQASGDALAALARLGLADETARVWLIPAWRLRELRAALPEGVEVRVQ